MNKEISEAFEIHERTTAPVRRGQKWFALAAGIVGIVVIVALGGRMLVGWFNVGEYEELSGGQVWLGIGVAFTCFLGSAAMAQVAVGKIGAKLLEKITPGP